MSGGEPLRFVDSHTHLADPAFDADRDAVIARATAAGCRAMVCIGETIDAAERALAIAAQHPGLVAATAGVHPHEASAFDQVRDPERLREFTVRGAVALGECGLDYHYDNAPRDVQRAVLRAHIALAAELGKPIVLHTREAEADTIAAVREARTAGVIGVLHCFGGGPDLATAALEAGWYVSFAGVVTFKKWTGDYLIRMVPDDRLLAESDAPYLTPVPYRGKRNEPAYVAHTVARIADARGVSRERVGALVSANAVRLFGLSSRLVPYHSSCLKMIISTPNAPSAIGPYSQGVVAGGFLFTAGQIALDPATMQVIEGDVVAQTERVMKNLTAVLEAAGSGWPHVVKTTVYLQDMADFPKLNEVYAKHVGDARPARSTVQVAGLPRGVLVEIDCIARVP